MRKNKVKIAFDEENYRMRIGKTKKEEGKYDQVHEIWISYIQTAAARTAQTQPRCVVYNGPGEDAGLISLARLDFDTRIDQLAHIKDMSRARTKSETIHIAVQRLWRAHFGEPRPAKEPDVNAERRRVSKKRLIDAVNGGEHEQETKDKEGKGKKGRGKGKKAQKKSDEYVAVEDLPPVDETEAGNVRARYPRIADSFSDADYQILARLLQIEHRLTIAPSKNLLSNMREKHGRMRSGEDSEAAYIWSDKMWRRFLEQTPRSEPKAAAHLPKILSDIYKKFGDLEAAWKIFWEGRRAESLTSVASSEE